jgi:transposase InsO family protein
MWVVFLGSKGEVVNAIRCKQAAVETECGRKLRVLYTDNDGEFTVAEFALYCANEGVQHHYSTSYNPQQNGVVERRNQTVVGMAQALLKQRGMPAVFWGEAVSTSSTARPLRLSTVARHTRLGIGTSRWSLTYGSPAASRSARSLATSASSTIGALRGCSSARWRFEGLLHS